MYKYKVRLKDGRCIEVRSAFYSFNTVCTLLSDPLPFISFDDKAFAKDSIAVIESIDKREE